MFYPWRNCWTFSGEFRVKAGRSAELTFLHNWSRKRRKGLEDGTNLQVIMCNSTPQARDKRVYTKIDINLMHLFSLSLHISKAEYVWELAMTQTFKCVLFSVFDRLNKCGIFSPLWLCSFCILLCLCKKKKYQCLGVQ